MLCVKAIYECGIGAHEKHLLPLRISCSYSSHNNLKTFRDIVLLGFNVSRPISEMDKKALHSDEVEFLLSIRR